MINSDSPVENNPMIPALGGYALDPKSLLAGPSLIVFGRDVVLSHYVRLLVEQLDGALNQTVLDFQGDLGGLAQSTLISTELSHRNIGEKDFEKKILIPGCSQVLDMTHLSSERAFNFLAILWGTIQHAPSSQAGGRRLVYLYGIEALLSVRKRGDIDTERLTNLLNIFFCEARKFGVGFVLATRTLIPWPLKFSHQMRNILAGDVRTPMEAGFLASMTGLNPKSFSPSQLSFGTARVIFRAPETSERHSIVVTPSSVASVPERSLSLDVATLQRTEGAHRPTNAGWPGKLSVGDFHSEAVPFFPGTAIGQLETYERARSSTDKQTVAGRDSDDSSLQPLVDKQGRLFHDWGARLTAHQYEIVWALAQASSDGLVFEALPSDGRNYQDLKAALTVLRWLGLIEMSNGRAFAHEALRMPPAPDGALDRGGNRIFAPQHLGY